jgi:hypothetical protein
VIENKWPFQGGDLVNNAMKRKMHDMCLAESTTAEYQWATMRTRKVLRCHDVRN